MHIGLFEPTVIFFGMTNSPATFQAIMDKILRDLVNKGKVTTFVDDILVEPKTEKRYDKIVKEVLRRMISM